MTLKDRSQSIADDLSKKLKFDVRFYGHSFSWLSVGHFSAIFRGLASTYLVARWVSPEILGQFRYVLTLYGLAGIFAFTGYGSSIIKGLARGETNAVRHAVKRVATYAPLGAVVLLLGALDRYLQGEQTVAYAIAIAALSFVPYTLCTFYTYIYTGYEQIKKLSYANIWSNIAYAVLFILTLLWSHNLIVITIAYFLIDILIRGWITWRAYRSIPRAATSPETHEVLGRHFNGINIMQSIAGAIGLILLQRVWGYTALAAFSVAMILPEQIINLAKTMNGTLLQRFSRKEIDPKSLQNIQKQFRLVFFGSLIITASYAAIAPFIVPLFFPQYPDAVLPSIIYAIGILVIPSLIGVNYFQSQADYKRIWKFYALSASLQILTSIVFIPWLGNWGAIWSRVITRVGSLPAGYPLNSVKEKTTPKI
ncbi:MAG: oligosaccharide flippase family protein [Candidatus Uhrbacteria bacterium]|nr:oligosaccharide flippase family protein [Candidatus Uhrbacteria bacterium]